ncbi:MAG: response regulator [Chloroflexi bacterium]|nr:response regulator [Chloroflexota bacterium]MCI0578724.1 response regulator [Chloroflexota bacterium]MCI0643991.1 response regulator [Chloroflexota bacterium]MCI0732010.1 response regulator [Chloroflexota bacterium]
MAEQKKILIVEDDVDLAEMLSAYFRVQGYAVSVAAWGEDAVRSVEDDVPDIAVLDIRLPDIDGYEVCRRIRKIRRAQHIPVIFLTEKRERDDKLAGLELGAVDYITKPFDIQELRLRVRNALRRSRMHTLVNAVTGLPEGRLVQERLEQMLTQPEWGLVFAGIRGLSKFRDKYGFVAADDVARAVSLMITNAMQDSGADEEFVGHIDAVDFVIITTPERCKKLSDNCVLRLQPSIQYFYPAVDRPHITEMLESERLRVQVTNLSSKNGQFATVDDLRVALKEN